jgi:hypothetical protein
MNVFILCVNIFLAYFLAFQAGQMKTLIDIDKQDGRKSDWKVYFFLIADSLISIYLIISIYGAGLRHDV